MNKTFTSVAFAALALFSIDASAQTQVKIESADPAINSTITSFTGLTVYLEGVSEITEFKTGEISYQYYNNAEPYATPAKGLTMEAELMPDKRGIYIGFSDAKIREMREAGIWPINQPGVYTVNLDPGDLTVLTPNGVFENAETNITYNIIPAIAPNISPDPEEGQYDISMIALTYPPFEAIEMTDKFKATLTGPAGEIKLSTSVQERFALVMTPESTITEPGKYTLKMEAGSLLLKENPNAPNQMSPELNIEYTVLDAPSTGYKSVSPAPGVIEQFSTLSVIYYSLPNVNKECKETAKLFINDELVSEFGATASRIQYPVAQDDPNLLRFVFTQSAKEVWTTPGKYKVVIPEGFVVLKNGMFASEIAVEYTIPKKVEYTYEPMNTTVESIEDFTITFKGASDIVQNKLQADDEGNGVIRLYAWTDEVIDEPEIKVSIDGNKVKFSTEKLTYKCQYELLVPLGAFTMTIDGERVDNPTIKLFYWIPKIPYPTLTPAAGDVTSDDLHEVKVTMAEGYKIDSWLAEGKLVKVNDEGVQTGSIIRFAKTAGDVSYKGTDNIVLHQLQPYKDIEPGLYAFTLPYSTFSVIKPDGDAGGYNNNPYTWYYNVTDNSAVNEIKDMAPEKFNVYRIDGVCVLHNADKAELSRLAKGLYIVNGKKMIIK